ncbi:MAG: hypothetical protein U1E06_23635 [Tabrizicola sp.]|nr:hypothetical protein [Tabrizicola sp.]MDP3263942.1 hypothetical protein [Tabrizicola sp.]MDP3647307.1 hypothetical protein [Paracoccaceae bacterium]MDZ4069793.1 hypothetical protein [Tabrizicola sp.]
MSHIFISAGGMSQRQIDALPLRGMRAMVRRVLARLQVIQA